MFFDSISGEMKIQNKSQDLGFQKDKLQRENDKDKVIGMKRYNDIFAMKWYFGFVCNQVSP